MTAIPMPVQTPDEIERALIIARAMAYAGIPIFVAEPCSGPRCTPECHRRNGPAGAKPGYHLPARWESTVPDQAAVDRWRPGWALCAVGGHVADFLDVDPRNGGAESAERLRAEGKEPYSYGSAVTPSGGTHSLIQPLGCGKGEVVKGVDLQGGRLDGGGRGFVFIAPTVRASKVDGVPRPYRWIREPDLAQLQQHRGSDQSGAALAAMLPERRSKPKPVGQTDDFYDELEVHTETAAHRCIASKGEEVTRHIKEEGWAGFRNVLNSAAYTLGAYVGSGYMSAEQATEHLVAAIRLAGYETYDENLRTIEIGIADGARWPIKVVRDHAPFGRTAGTAGEFGAKLIDAADLGELPDPEPMVKGWLYQNTVARIVGQPGAYKSFVALDMALCVALGRPWHGRPVEQTPVLYVVGEGLAGYKLRVAAWCEHNGVAQEELRGKLLLTRQSVQIGGEDWPGLTAWVIENKARLVVVDTLARATVGAEENSNSEQGAIIEHCHALRAEVNGVLLLVHHTGHANGEAAERGRGASAWRGAVDTELLVRKLGEYTGSIKCDRQKDAESGQEVMLRMVKVGKSLAPQIADEVPLSPRSQYIVDQVAAGVRWASSNEMVAAVRNAGHKVSNNDKKTIFDEYNAELRKITSESYDPNIAAPELDPDNPYR